MSLEGNDNACRVEVASTEGFIIRRIIRKTVFASGCACPAYGLSQAHTAFSWLLWCICGRELGMNTHGCTKMHRATQCNTGLLNELMQMIRKHIGAYICLKQNLIKDYRRGFQPSSQMCSEIVNFACKKHSFAKFKFWHQGIVNAIIKVYQK